MADYTAAIKILAEQPAKAVSAHLRRLYRRRGDAYVSLQKWSKAVDDYARVVTAATTDETLLSNQALAQARVLLERESATARVAAMAFTDPWQELATAYRLKGDQQAIDQLVERHPKLAGRIGDLFTQGKDEDRDWRRAIVLYSNGITGETTDALLFSKRARAHEALKNWDAAAADWSRAATGNPEGAKLLAEFARRLAAGGQIPLAKAQFEKSRALYERALEADPESDPVATDLAQLLWDKHENDNPPWTVLTPTKMQSKGGATLSKLPDDSILASGKNPLGDAYTIVAPTNVPRVSAIRLEALTHESLPNQGPGRDEERDRGNFEMVHFTIRAQIHGTQPRLVELSRVAADFFSFDLSANRWNIADGQSRPHTAVYLAKQPVDCQDGARLEFEMQFSANADWPLQNLGRFRLSVSGDPAAFDREQKHLVAMKLTDPWAKLAAAYHIAGDRQALDKLLKYHPTATAGFGDLYAAGQEWELAMYRKLVSDRPADVALLRKLAAALQGAGRTREGVPYLAKAYFANPQDTILSLEVAARQAWFGQEKELAATRQRILAFAKGTNDAVTAERTARACSILPSTDKAELKAALALGRTAVKVEDTDWNLLALGVAEYRSGNHVAAAEALLAATKAGLTNPAVASQAALYRAMSLFRLGKVAEARRLAMAAAAEMKPLPADEQNPLADNGDHNDLIRWLAYKEAKALIKFEVGPPPKAESAQSQGK